MPKYIKKLEYGKSARDKIKAGVDKTANAVKITLGPRGQNVLMENPATPPTSSKDGVTVARSITLSDKYENMGADLIKEIASKTESSAGDGTTTTAILAQALLNSGMGHIESGINPVEVRRGIQEAVDVIEKRIVDGSKPANESDIEKVAAISANDPELGKIVAKVFDAIGKDGVISVEQSQGRDIETEVVKGLQIDKGFASPYFITDTERNKFKSEGMNVFITDQHLVTQQDVIPLMESLKAAGREKMGTLIIAEEISGEALGVLVVNRLRGAFPCVAVKAPSFGERRADILRDIAMVTGSNIVSQEAGKSLENIEIEDIGFAESVTSNKDRTIIIGDSRVEDEVDQYVANLEDSLSETNAVHDIDHIKKRIAKITSGVAVIRVGADTETEMKELQYRLEDAVEACKSAAEEGIVIGGGMALYQAREALAGKRDVAGFDAVYSALSHPLKTLIQNAGYNEQGILKKLDPSNLRLGFNAETGEVEDLIQAGVVDATKVVRMALRNAASIVGLVLITGAVVAIEEPEERQND